MIEPSTSGCLTEDELLGLAAGDLADAPTAEAHLATCATCSALLAGIVRTPPAWDDLAGTTLGPYRIDAQIGAGGMGAVYRAWDPRLGRAIAVKVLTDRDPSRAARLASEARAAASIEHRAVVGIYDVGVAGDIAYVAMELVDGESLRSVLAAGGLGVSRATALLQTLVDGLVAAHARGVIHRDLKPENLLLSAGGLRILDFGLAKLLDGSPLDATEPGTVQGTAGYMAPEQARGATVDARADLFATGAIAYELVTGRRAFPGTTNADRLSATLRDTPSLDELGTLAPVVARCLAKEPRDRFQTAADLAWALREPSPTPAKRRARGVSRRGLVIGGAAALGAGALGFLLGGRRSPARVATPSLRYLTHRAGRVFTARFTREGGRVVYGGAWDDHPLQVYSIDLGSGNTTALDLRDADLFALSANDEIAASLSHRFVDHQSSRGQLVVQPLAGGLPRPLADDIEAADFVPDLTTRPGRRSREGEANKLPAGALAVVRPTETGFRVDLPLDTTIATWDGWITHLRISPDARYAAFLRHPHTNDDAGMIVLVDLATRTSRTLGERWTSIAGLAWDPDSASLWFTASTRGSSNTLHRITLDGELIQIPGPTADRLRLHDIAEDRRLLVTVDTWALRAMAGTTNHSLSEVSYVSDLSSDGTQVLIGELGTLDGTGAYLAPYAGGKRLRLGPGFPVAISPSGQRVAANVHEETRLVVYLTGSGEAPVIPTPGFVTYARWLDETTLVATFRKQLYRLAIDKPPTLLANVSGTFALDPARVRAAAIDRKHTLQVIDLATGQVRALPGTFVHAVVCGWLADGESILVASTTTPIVVERVDVRTGARTRHAEIQPPRLGLKAVDSFVMHADGIRHAYSYGQELSQLAIYQPPR